MLPASLPARLPIQALAVVRCHVQAHAHSRTHAISRRADYYAVVRYHAGTAAWAALLHTATDGPHRALSALERLAASKAATGGTPMDRSAGRTALCLMDWVTLPCAENFLK